ncbi:MAG: hypothetical protein ACPG5T_04485 [Endozoicomonas sp.]
MQVMTFCRKYVFISWFILFFAGAVFGDDQGGDVVDVMNASDEEITQTLSDYAEEFASKLKSMDENERALYEVLSQEVERWPEVEFKKKRDDLLKESGDSVKEIFASKPISEQRQLMKAVMTEIGLALYNGEVLEQVVESIAGVIGSAVVDSFKPLLGEVVWANNSENHNKQNNEVQ